MIRFTYLAANPIIYFWAFLVYTVSLVYSTSAKYVS